MIYLYSGRMNKDTFIKVRVARDQRDSYAEAASDLGTNISKEMIRCLDRMVKRAGKGKDK